MENKNIIIKINNEEIVVSSSNPDLKNLVKSIIKIDRNYDFSKIVVECNDDNFDKESFKNIIIEAIKDFFDKITINILNTKESQNELKKIIEELEAECDDE